MDRTPKRILEDKKKRFLLEVDKASDNLNVKVREVKFWKEYDKDHFNKGERAHIHLEEQKICIAETQLNEMSNEDIIEIAHHEVSHLKHINHDTDFHNTLEDSKTTSWQPPAGTMHIFGGNPSRKYLESNNLKEKRKNECSECSENKGIKKCKYCGRPFCKGHINARVPVIGHYSKVERDETPNSHACFQYGRFKEVEEKRIDEEYRKKLDRILSSNPNKKTISPDYHKKNNLINSKKIPMEEDLDFEEETSFLNRNQLNEKRRKPSTKLLSFHGFRAILLGIILIISLFFIYIYVYSEEEVIGNVTSIDAFSKEAFDYVNKYRSSNNVNPLNLSFELYPALIEVCRKKQLDDNSLKTFSEINNFLRTEFNVSDFSFQYTHVYFIKGLGIDGFKSEFDKAYSARKIIKDKKYVAGGIGCELDYCILSIVSEPIYEKNEPNPIEITENKPFIKEQNISTDVNEILFIKKLNEFFSISKDKFSNWLSTIFRTEGKTEKVGNFVKGIFDPKSQIDITELELEIHRLINIERQESGLRALSFDSKLANIAREHSQDMAQYDFFDHSNLQGKDPTDRADLARYSCRKDYGSYYTEGIAENIAMTPIYSNVEGCGSTTSLESLAECIVDGWMTSPGHRENILTATYDKEGIGVAYSSDNEAYSTQDFC